MLNKELAKFVKLFNEIAEKPINFPQYVFERVTTTETDFNKVLFNVDYLISFTSSTHRMQVVRNAASQVDRLDFYLNEFVQYKHTQFGILFQLVKTFYKGWQEEFSAFFWHSDVHLFFSAFRDGQRPSHLMFKLFEIGVPSRITTRREFISLCHSSYLGAFYKVCAQMVIFYIFVIPSACCFVVLFYFSFF